MSDHSEFLNVLYYGDNLDVLQRYIADESIDLIYLDPPFKSDQDYNVLFQEKNGSNAAAQIKAFHDTWQWDQVSAKAFHDIVSAGGRVADVMVAYEKFIGHNDMLAYLSMMAPRLVELHRVLKNTGSLYLHCDTTASHYLKLLLDAVFGPENFRNEIIWRRTGSNKSVKRFGPIHQSIFFYRKTSDSYFNPICGPYTENYVEKFFIYEDSRGIYQSVALTGPGIRSGDSGLEWEGYNPTDVGRHWQPASYVYSKYQEVTGDDLSQYPLIERLTKLDEADLIHWGSSRKTVPRYKYYIDDAPGVLYQDIWAYQPGTEGCVYGNPDDCIDQDVKWLSTQDKERLGYPTQKPEGVLERIIRASSKDGDVVLDPFCGCGTTISVAQRLNRSWIGIDITHLSIALMKHRLRSAFESLEYSVIGEPVSLPDAKTLASQDPFQFQWWALGLVGARPVEQKKGSDKGIDGRLYFFTGPNMKGKPEQIIFSVKAGNVTVSQVRDLVGVIDREGAAIGVFISLNNPTRPMIEEAASAGFYRSNELIQNTYPRIQLLTIEELLDGKQVEYPAYAQWRGNVTLKRAPKAQKKKIETKNEKLDKFAEKK